MNKIVNYLTILFAFSYLYTNAQITITSDDLPKVGDNFALAFDSSSISQYQSYIDTTSADSQYWDLGGLNVSFRDTFAYFATTSTPYANDFPDANLTVWIQEARMYLFFDVDTSSGINGVGINVNTEGYEDFLDGASSLNMPASKEELYLSVPSTYNSSATNSALYTRIIGTSGDTGVDYTVDKTLLFDGWGTVVTPYDTFETVRMYEYSISVFTFWVKFFGIKITLAEISRDTSVSYKYFVKGYTYPVATLNADSKNKLTSIEYLYAQNIIPNAGFYVDNQYGIMNEEIPFRNTSSGSTGWKWDFGDGTTSTEHQPRHAYTSNGTYDVKLVASNSSGADSIVKSSYIIDAVVADFGSMVTGLQVQFYDSSLNDVNFWSWDFGDGNLSIEQSPKHTYANPGTYQVTLLAQNVASMDTKTDSITVDYGVGMYENDLLEKVNIYPNPNDGNFTLIVDGNNETELYIEITNTSGQIVFNEKLNKLDRKFKRQLNVSGYSKGIYTVKVKGNDMNIVKTFVVN